MWVEKHRDGWRIRDRVGGKLITVESGYPNKTIAKNAMVSKKADKLRGDALVHRGGRMLMADWVAIWLPGYQASLKPSAAHSEPSRVRNHVLPLLGHHELDEVDSLAVQQWVAQLLAGERNPADPAKWRRRPLKPKTVHNCHGVLFSIMQAAVNQRLIRSNPCGATRLPKRQRKEMRFLTEPEFARLLAALPPHWRPMILLLVSTGLRWGEAAGLRVGRVDLLAKVPALQVLETLHELSGLGIVFTGPKTARSRRTVTFTRLVADTLAGLVVGERDALVFSAPMGGPARTRNFRRTWLTACRRAGLEELRVHDLRHTHAAWLISANVPLTAIQHRLGHSSIAVTSDLYGHLLPAVDEGILAAVTAALSGIDADALATELDDELVGSI